MTIDTLRRAEARYQRASQSFQTARLSREDAIREAASEGLSTRQIAKHVALTAQRVQQIVAK